MEKRPLWQGALAGGLAGCTASTVSMPFESLKVRVQLKGELQKGSVHVPLMKTVKQILQEESFLALYNGLSASLFRFAMKEEMGRMTEERWGKGSVPYSIQLLCGMIAGGVSAVLCSPADLMLLRMQGGRLKGEGQYTNVFDGFRKVINEKGVLELWRGCGPNIVRAIVVTAAQFFGYDVSKEILVKNFNLDPKDFSTHLIASLMAGVFVAITNTPFDVIRTRVMNSRLNAGYKGAVYTSGLDCAVQLFKTEGVRAFWKGMVPYYFRIGPHVTTMFVTYEQYQKMIDRFRGVKVPSGVNQSMEMEIE